MSQMSLCNTCRSVGLLDIPKLPASCNGYAARNESAALISVMRRRTKSTTASEVHDGPLGKPFHQSLEALAAAAIECAVCKVIEQDITVFREEFANVKHEEQLQRKRCKGPDWKMWLVQGKNDISGFMVVSPDVENNIDVWVLSAIGLCTGDDDSLSSIVTGRKVEGDPTSDLAIRRASTWVKQCDAEHEEARSKVEQVLLPSKVLDVKSTAAGGISLYASNGEKGRYAALSHVRDTNQLGKKDVDLENLPTTFKDAIIMTRMLGLQYLWIDALCNSQEDRTSIVSAYENAYITLSATGSSSDDYGMLIPRSPPTYTSFPYTHNDTYGTIYASSLPKEPALYPSNDRILTPEPLSQHSWALQDRLLSPRILHFGTSQLYFECDTHFVSEDGFKMCGRDDTLYGATSPDRCKITTPHPHAYKLWQRIVHTYCRRSLPAQSDKLPALSSLAAKIADQTGDTYVAGLWRAHLHDDLIWQATGFVAKRTREPTQYRAPSWSWASIDGPFGIFVRGTGWDVGKWTDVATVLDCHVTLKGEDPYGEVSDAWIKLRAPLEQLFVCEEAPVNQFWKIRTALGTEGGTRCIFDTMARAEEARSGPLFALIVTKAAGSRGDDEYYHCVVVASVSGRNGVYKRMGKAVIGHEALGQCEWMQDESKLIDVTLV